MSNSLLTPTKIVREALRIAHQRSNFVSNLERKYENEFGVEGAKIGSTCKVRLPNKFTSTASATLNVQDVTEASVDVTVNTRRHIGMSFSMASLTLTIDDFSKRYIAPAVSQLMADVEYDTIANLYKGVYNHVIPSTATAALDLATVGGARRKLTENLAPDDGEWIANIMPRQTQDLIDAGKALFHSSTEIDKQYKKGIVGMTSGFTFYENTLWPRHTPGTAAVTAFATDDAAGEADGSTGLLHIDGAATTLVTGDIITVAGVYRVHPESKVSTGELQQFVVTADFTPVGNEGDVSISPTMVASGAKQNVSNVAADGQTVTKVGGNVKAYDNSLAFHPQFAAFVAPPLDMPPNVWGARETMDGISLRVVKQYDIVNDVLPARIDIQYGSALLRPEWAVRVASRMDA